MSSADVEVALAFIIFTCTYQIFDLLQRRRLARLDSEGNKRIATHRQLSREYELKVQHNLRLLEKFEEDLNITLAHHREDFDTQMQNILEEEIAQYRKAVFIRLHVLLGGK